jgi:uncharacterized membrane protein YesL
MGIFSGMYEPKNNRGINPNDPKSPPLIYFFELLGRKLINLIQLNSIHVVCSIPALILLFYFAPVFFSFNFIELNTIDDQANNYIIKFGLSIFFLIIPAVCVGPAQAGFTFVVRNFVREEHVWIFHDYFKHAKENLKQSLIICGINFVILYMMMVAFNSYYIAFSNGGSVVPLIFLSIAMLLFLMINMYIYPLMVTFKLSVLQLYRNALLFSYMRFYLNIIIILLSFAIFIVLLSFAQPLFFLALYIFILPSFIGFLSTFVVYPALKKYMIDVIDKSKLIK